MLMNNTRAKLKSVQRGLPWAEQFIYSLAFGMLAVAVCLNTEAESDTVRVFPFCVCETNLLGLIVTWWVSVAWFKHIFFFFFSFLVGFVLFHYDCLWIILSLLKLSSTSTPGSNHLNSSSLHKWLSLNISQRCHYHCHAPMHIVQQTYVHSLI